MSFTGRSSSRWGGALVPSHSGAFACSSSMVRTSRQTRQESDFELALASGPFHGTLSPVFRMDFQGPSSFRSMAGAGQRDAYLPRRLLGNFAWKRKNGCNVLEKVPEDRHEEIKRLLIDMETAWKRGHSELIEGCFAAAKTRRAPWPCPPVERISMAPLPGQSLGRPCDRGQSRAGSATPRRVARIRASA